MHETDGWTDPRAFLAHFHRQTDTPAARGSSTTQHPRKMNKIMKEAGDAMYMHSPENVR